MEKKITEKNTTSDNVSYLTDNKSCICRHEKLHPLTARKGGFISEGLYRYIEKSFDKNYLDTSLQLQMKGCILLN